MANDDRKEQQLELPLVGEKLPPRAAQRRARDVQNAEAALRAAKLRKAQKIEEMKSAVRAARRRMADSA